MTEHALILLTNGLYFAFLVSLVIAFIVVRQGLRTRRAERSRGVDEKSTSAPPDRTPR